MKKISNEFYVINKQVYAILKARFTIEFDGQTRTRTFRKYAVLKIENYEHASGAAFVDQKKKRFIYELTLLAIKDHVFQMLETFEYKKEALAYLQEIDDE